MNIKKLGIVSLFIFVLGAVQPAFAAALPRQRVRLAPGTSTSGFSRAGKPAAHGLQSARQSQLSAEEKEKLQEFMMRLEGKLPKAERINKLTKEELAKEVREFDFEGPFFAEEAVDPALVSDDIEWSLALYKQLVNVYTLKTQATLQLFLARARVLKDQESIIKLQNELQKLNQTKAQSLRNIDIAFARLEKLKGREGSAGSGEQPPYAGGSESTGRRRGEEAMEAPPRRGGSGVEQRAAWGATGAFGSQQPRSGEQPREVDYGYGSESEGEEESKEYGQRTAPRPAAVIPQKAGGRVRPQLPRGAGGFGALPKGGKSRVQPKSQPPYQGGSESDVDEYGLPDVPTRNLSGGRQSAAVSDAGWWAEVSRIRPLEPSTRVQEQPSYEVGDLWALSPVHSEQPSMQTGGKAQQEPYGRSEKLSPKPATNKPAAVAQQKPGGRSRVRLAPGTSTSGFSATSKKSQFAAPKPLVSAKPGKTLVELQKIADAYADNWDEYMLDLSSALTESELDNQVAGLTETIEQSIEAAKALDSKEGASLAYEFESYGDALKAQYGRAKERLSAPQVLGSE